MTVAVLFPFGSSDDFRDRAFQFVAEWYRIELPGVIRAIGTVVSGEWSKGEAVANALAETDAETLVIADADSYLVPPETIRQAVALVEAGTPWVVPHTHVHRLTEAETARVYAGATPRLGKVVRQVYTGPAGGGIVVLTRTAWDTVRGIDPRFLGWGGEDLSFGYALETLVAPVTRLDGALVHLWHPHPAPDLRGSEASEALVAEYREARGFPRRMRAVIDTGVATPPKRTEHPVRFRMQGNRRRLRLGAETFVDFPDGTYETDDPDYIDALRAHPMIREDRR